MTARSYPKAPMTQRKAEAALVQLLYGCTIERLHGFTAAGLAASYRVKLNEAERMLAAARARRR